MITPYELPYDFVLKALYPVRPSIRKMMGGYALMNGNRLLMLLRDREQQPEFNGVFVAAQPASFGALQQEIHVSKMTFDLDGSENSWIFISEDLDDFEAKVKKACDMIKAADQRIGIDTK